MQCGMGRSRWEQTVGYQTAYASHILCYTYAHTILNNNNNNDINIAIVKWPNA